MNKKIVGFVLAMCLTLGLGVSSLFAGNNSTSSEKYDTSIANIKDNGDGSITVEMTANEKAIVGNITSRISSVFTYKAGMLLAVMDKDRNITLYDQGKPRMTLSYQAKNDGSGTGTFAVTSFNIYGTDIDDIKKVGGIENYLKTFGITDEQMHYTKDGKEGPVDGEQVKVAWLAELEEHLAKGINFSATINITEAKGASVTLQENGKNLKTIAYDGTVTQEFVYNAHGTLSYVQSTTYKLKGSDDDYSKNPPLDKNKVGYDKSYQRTYYDVYGRASRVEDANGKVLNTYSYAYNGSMISSFDAATGNTTYYEAGKVSYVLNSSGAVTARYAYHANGSLDGVYSYAYDDDGNLTATEISAYKFGQFIASADLSSEGGSRTFEEIRNAVSDMRSQSKGYTKAQADHVQSLMTKIHEARKSSDTAKEKAAKDELYKYTSNIGIPWLISIQNGNESIMEVKGSTVRSNSSKYSNLKNIAIYPADLENKGFLYSLGFTDDDIKFMAATNNGTSALATVTFTFGSIEHGSHNDGNVAYVGEATHEKIVSEGKEGVDLTISITVNDRGAQAYTIDEAAKYQIKAAVDEVTTTIDPAAEGKFGGFYYDKETGQKYAKIEVAKINMLDGNDWQAAGGETFLIPVNGDEWDNVQIGESVAVEGFMGTDVNGYKTITNGKMAIGKDDVNKFVNLINTNSDYKALAKFNKELFSKLRETAGIKGTSYQDNYAAYNKLMSEGRSDEVVKCYNEAMSTMSGNDVKAINNIVNNMNKKNLGKVKTDIIEEIQYLF